jgi:dipeptidyl aminopeptidase/acylaminoacyl peptidase
MKTPGRLLVATIAAGTVAVNVVAFMQARAMTHFSGTGERTAPPERLTALEAAWVLVAGVNVPRPENASIPDAFGLSFAADRFPSAHGPTLESWYVPGNERGPLVLLFHGYAASKSAMLPIAQGLHALGYASLLVDFYGSGGSSGTGTTLGVVEADDVMTTVRYARRRWPERKVVPYGISMGGAAVLRAVAVDQIEPDAVIVEDTFASLLETAKTRFRTLGVPATPFSELLLFWGGVQWGFDPFAHDPVRYARAVRCPALVLQGADDARVSVAEARSLAEAMGTSARLVIYPGVSHVPSAQARPADWARDVQAFLAQL